MLQRLFIVLQYCLPRHALTALVYRLARVRVRWIKDHLIAAFVRAYGVDLEEVDGDTPGDFATFNHFFTRALAEGSRVVDEQSDAIVSPVDGTVSVAAPIEHNSLIQAKGIDYTLQELLAVDLENANAYRDGLFATLYLAPFNYHRVHMPLDGELLAAHYVPGDLFSVNQATVAGVPGLFRRNERLNLHFRTAAGPAALIFVGALNVGSISTPWTGEIRPRKTGIVETQDLSAAPTQLRKGDLLGWFNMGSTVIVLLPKNAARWQADLVSGKSLQMGERIGTLVTRV